MKCAPKPIGGTSNDCLAARTLVEIALFCAPHCSSTIRLCTFRALSCRKIFDAQAAQLDPVEVLHRTSASSQPGRRRPRPAACSPCDAKAADLCSSHSGSRARSSRIASLLVCQGNQTDAHPMVGRRRPGPPASSRRAATRLGRDEPSGCRHPLSIYLSIYYSEYLS